VDTVRSTTNPSCGRFNGLGIWYKIKPFTSNANLRASTCNAGTNFDTVITVYQGDNCRPRQCVAQNDDFPGLYLCSTVGFAVSPFVTYWIFIDGFSIRINGNFVLTVDVV
jgi:hypothetical protein